MIDVAFLGTPEIAVPALRLLAARCRVRLVVTQPDRPAGRGQRLQAPPVKLAAEALGLPVWQPETLKGQEADPRLQGLDLLLVMAYGELLRRPLLALPRYGCVNLHASLLPRWRGASPLQAVLRAGETRSGVTVMRMVPGLDAGPIYLQEAFDLPDEASLPWLHDRMAEAAAVALGRFLDTWPPPEPLPQDEAAVTLCRKLDSADGHLRFDLSAIDISRWVRAYTPAPGCWAETPDGQRLRIHAVSPQPGAAPLPPGVCAVVDGRLLVGSADVPLSIERLQSPGARAMDARDWLNGHAAPLRLA